MVFNGTLTSNTNIPVQVLRGVDELTNHLLGSSLLLIIFLIVYFSNGGDPTRESFAGAAFITMVAALLLRYLGLVTDGILALSIVACLGSVVFLVVRT